MPNAALRYGVQTPFSDQLSFQWEGGLWKYDVQHDSIITAGNGGTKASQAAFTIFYNQGKEKYELQQTLQPDEQMWIDIGKLIRDRVPDKNGKTLPEDLTSGSYQLRDLTEIGVGRLFEGKVTYDKTFGNVAYGCAFCCAYDPVWLDYDPLGMAVGAGAGNYVYAGSPCDGGNIDVSSGFYNNWNTANHSIATVNGTGYHTGVGAGSTTSSTSGYLAHLNGRNCPATQRAPTGGDNVGPYQVEILATASQGAANCPVGQAGWSKNTTNQIQYFGGAAFAFSGIDTADTISIGGTNQLGISGSQSGHAPTTGDGSFPDTYFVCSSVCPGSSGSTNALQNWTANGVPLPHADSVVYKCSSITVDGR